MIVVSLQVSFGRMIYSDKLQKGTIDKSFQIKKIAVSLVDNYASLLSRCVSELWPSEAANSEKHIFYLADSTGARIEPILQWVTAGTTERNELDWTLENYIKLSGRYLSKLRLYCVKTNRETAQGLGYGIHSSSLLYMIIISTLFIVQGSSSSLHPLSDDTDLFSDDSDALATSSLIIIIAI